VPETRRKCWNKLIAEQQTSRLSVVAFCRERGISEPSFYYWRKRLRENGTVRFALLETKAATADTTPAIELVLARSWKAIINRLRHLEIARAHGCHMAADSIRRARQLRMEREGSQHRVGSPEANRRILPRDGTPTRTSDYAPRGFATHPFAACLAAQKGLNPDQPRTNSKVTRTM